ncbi:dihydroorotate dehydrogenase [bacterium]|jgi:dihydroorotate dehydrogenase (NAD+) catalytic subunit|nr:dihydroorotate dehydrogenase [bacterium]MBT4763563.1 dihydroorotate dehydrogenase [bacterium]MBT5400935.1 dihydroorotate dehydrogenase [bacterium]MBT5942254.1 dihydroorotate dehydrogenase [bacterium]MBT6068095.1 dihydroorotate dehydrogenase [bacterium]
MINLEIKINNLKLKNPTILASGILGVSSASLNNVVRNGAGAVVTKSISKEPRKGHPSPIIATYEEGMLNAVGYPNQGSIKASQEFSNVADIEAPVILSIIGQKEDDFKAVYNELKNCNFKAIEVPLSCPHTPGYGTMGGQHTPEMATKITKTLKEITDLPIWIKLSPNENLVEVGKAAEAAGADAIVAGNTMGPGMIIDIDTYKPVLGFGMGGVSGPALRPIAVRCVFDLYKAVKVPIIGCGGVTTGRDLIEMMMAGATGIGVGTAVLDRSVNVFSQIMKETEEWLKENDFKKIEDIIGLTHK